MQTNKSKIFLVRQKKRAYFLYKQYLYYKMDTHYLYTHSIHTLLITLKKWLIH